MTVSKLTSFHARLLGECFFKEADG